MTSGAPATLADQLRAALADRYRIERELGTGGMATVYLAHDERHDRKVAIKVLKPELAAVLGADRFIVEIKTTAALQHPHILPLFDSGTADGFLYYVMPYIQGETIREKLNRETQFGVVEAVRIAREVADALDYAHRHGVIHRDIKPENLLLHDGRAMVMDFGIALAVSAAAGGRMTETGLSLGTPHYMSPEQATAEKEITGRSDVYSLASVLYEMLTGEPPHMGNSAQQIIMKIITDTPQPVTALRKSVPPNVAAAVANALEKLPADRFESAKAFADALEDPAFTTAGTGVLAAGGARGGRRSLVTWALAAASLATLAIGYGVGRRTASAPEARPVQFLVEAPDSVVALNRCCGPAQALSPDGATLVYVGMRSDGGSLYRRSLDRLTSERIPGADEATTPFFSPNGQWVAFSSAGQLKKVSMAGGPALPIAAAELTGGSWGDNDVIIFSRRGSNLLWRVPASGGTPTRVPTSDSLVELSVPFVLPGATHALVNVRSATVPDSWQIGVVDLRSGKIEQIGPGTRAEYANGAIVYTALDNTLLAQPFDLRSRKTTGQAVPIATGVSFSGATLHEFSVSASGLLEYEVGRLESGEQLRVVGGGAGAGTTIPLPGRASANLEDPAISPDGRQIVLRLPAGNIGDLWIMNRQNGTLNRFTVSGGGAAPSWSRDGRFIAYYAPGDSTVKAGIYIRAVDQPDAKLVRAGHNLFPGSWFPDGRSITFATNDPLNKNVALGASLGSFDIGKVTLGDTAVTWLVKTPFSERQPELSPDGRLLAYASNLTSRPEVFVQLLTGGSSPVQVSSEGASSPRWSRDGHTLFYVTPGGSIIAATIAPGAGITVVKRTQVATVLVMDLNTQNVNWDLFPDDKPMVIDQSGGQGRRRMALVQNWPALARALGEGAKR